MISDTALGEACRPAVLGRARVIARSRDGIWKRVCSYDGPVTCLSARVASTSGDGETYVTTISFDESTDVVHDYSCTCPAARRFSGACKHSIALALAFNKDTESFTGYDRLFHVSTSPALLAFLGRDASAVRLRPTGDTSEQPGTVSLVPVIMRDHGINLRLRIVGSQGAYAVKSIARLADNVSQGSFFSYGKRLAFAHTLDMFDEPSARLARFVVRAIHNRRAFAADGLQARPLGVYGSSQGGANRDLRLSGPELDELMGMLVGSTVEYVNARREGASTQGRPLKVRDGDPRPRVLIRSKGDHGSFELAHDGALEFYATEERLYAMDRDSIIRCPPELRELAPFLTVAFAGGTTRLMLSERDAPRFAATLLPRLERAISVDVPPEMEALRPDPVSIEFRLDRDRSGVTCDVVAVYGEKSFHVAQRQASAALDASRDAEAEADARQLAGRYLTLGRTDLARIPARNADAIARLVFEGTREMGRMGRVITTPAFDALVSRVTPSVRVALAVRSNLISLSVSADDLPLSELYALLDSYRKNQRFHRLSDGSFVDLSKGDLSEAARLADELGLTAAELASGTIEIPSYKAFLLDSIMSDEEKDESFVRCVEGFRSVDPAAYEPPAELAGRLRPYQRAGFQWMSALCDMGFGGILADEMGLGKSVQLISLLLARAGEGRSLVVCPASLVYNWQSEFEKFAPSLDVAPVVGNAAERRQIRSDESHQVLITSYDLLRRDIEDYGRMSFWGEFLDEAQFIKNHETLVSRAAKAVRAEHRMALTGTPIENRLSELWSIFDFLMPGLLGGYDRFRDRFELPMAAGDVDAAERLRNLTAPFVLRRLKSEVLRDLPDKLEQVVLAPLEGEQGRLYRAHEQALRLALTRQSDASFSREKLQVLAELTRLRQLCCDPSLVYDEYEGSSAKLDTILSLVSSIVDAQSKMLIFSQFTSFLDIIASKLDDHGVRYYMLTGSTPKRRRIEMVDAFNHDETPVFLISLKAGGTGLNLTGADEVIHVDPWWNPAVEDQATDRAHRIGQKNTVYSLRLITTNTIEERVLQMQRRKRAIIDQIVGGDEQTMAKLTWADVQKLLDIE